MKVSSRLRDSAFFHNLAYISRESDCIFMKILSQMYRDTDSDPDNLLIGGHMRSLTAVVGIGLQLEDVSSRCQLSVWTRCRGL